MFECIMYNETFEKSRLCIGQLESVQERSNHTDASLFHAEFEGDKPTRLMK